MPHEFPTQDPHALAELYASDEHAQALQAEAAKKAQEARLGEWFGTPNEMYRPTDSRRFEFTDAATNPATAKDLKEYFNDRPENAEQKSKRDLALDMLDNSNVKDSRYEKSVKTVAEKNTPMQLARGWADVEKVSDPEQKTQLKDKIQDAISEQIYNRLESDGEPQTAENYSRYLAYYTSVRDKVLAKANEAENAQGSTGQSSISPKTGADQDNSSQEAKTDDAAADTSKTPDTQDNSPKPKTADKAAVKAPTPKSQESQRAEKRAGRIRRAVKWLLIGSDKPNMDTPERLQEKTQEGSRRGLVVVGGLGGIAVPFTIEGSAPYRSARANKQEYTRLGGNAITEPDVEEEAKDKTTPQAKPSRSQRVREAAKANVKKRLIAERTRRQAPQTTEISTDELTALHAEVERARQEEAQRRADEDTDQAA